MERLATEAHDAQMWDALLPIATAFTPEARTRLAGLRLLQRQDVLQAAVGAASSRQCPRRTGSTTSPRY